MTKGEEFERAWRLGFQGDFSMVDKIYHPNYKSIDHRFGIEVNIDSDKAMISTVAGNVVFGPFRTLYENDEILVIHRYNIFLEDVPRFNAVLSCIHYAAGRIITQESTVEELDYDPAENQDWDWEDYK